MSSINNSTFDFYKENKFIVHNNDGSTSIVTCKTIPNGISETVSKLFPTLDRKVINIPKKKQKSTIIDRLCQADKEYNTKFKEIIKKNSLAVI